MKKIVIICDFNKSSGFGHITRMSSLSKSFNLSSEEVTFLFELRHKKFIQNHVKDLKCKYVSFSLRKTSKKIEEYLSKNLVDIVVFDSYLIDIKLEKKLYKNFFVVSIDDKGLKHNSHIVFNSREDLLSHKFCKAGHLWFTGKNFLLMNETKKKYKNKNLIKKILIHAGGSSAYKLINNFFNSSITYLSNKDVVVDILYNNIKNYKDLIAKIDLLVGQNKKYRLLKFNNSFSKNIYKYDVVAGPAGTTTFETMSSGVLNFSFPLINDGRDSMLTWNLLGNIIHLDFNERNNKIIIEQMWNYVFLNYKMLDKNIKKNSKLIFDNSKYISNLIKKYQKNKSLLFTKFKDRKDTYKIKKAELKFARSFLISRNSLRVRRLSSNPNHIIGFPEHLNWWKDNKIKKFILLKNKSIPSAYHWIKLLNKDDKKIIISGWFLDNNENDSLRMSFEIIKHQKNIIKKYYKGYNWLININKKNNLSIRMNESIGFKKASPASFEKAIEIFKFNKKNFNVYEMKL